MIRGVLTTEVENLMDTVHNAVCVSALNIENGTATQADCLRWLVNLTEIWAIQTQEEEAVA
jgi:hypothetical protein